MRLLRYVSIIVYVAMTNGHFYSSKANRKVSYTEIIAETESPSLISCTLFCRRSDVALSAVFKRGTCKCVRESEISEGNDKEETWTGTLMQSLAILSAPWRHIEIVGNKELAIRQGQLVATIPKLSKDYIFSFDIKITQLTMVFTNIILLTIFDYETRVYGYRTPGIWNLGTELAIHSAVNNDIEYAYRPKNVLQLNSWVSVKVSQLKNSKDNSYWFYVAVDEKQIHKEVNNNPAEFTNVRCYIAVNYNTTKPWLKSANGFVKNVWLETYG